MSLSIDEAREKVRQFKAEAEDTKTDVRDLNRLLTTYVALSRKAGLPPEIMDLIAKVQQARILVQTLIKSIQMLYLTSGPIGWLLGLGGIALSGLMVFDLVEIERPQY